MLKTWIFYIVLLVAAGVFNRIEPGYISSIIFYVMFFTPVISLIHVGFTYAVFKISHGVDKSKVSKGDEIVYRIKLINPTAILMAPFSLHYTASEKLFKDAKNEIDRQIIVAEKKRVTIRKHLACNYRGNYYIGVDRVVIRDYFGFFALYYGNIEQHKVLVYPKLRELKSNLLKNVLNESSESIISRDTQNQAVFTDIRDFQPGDPLNRIHWKLTAKSGSFISKDYAGQMTNHTKVFLDTYDLYLGEEDAVVYEDYMVEACVSIIHFLLENRINTHLYYERFGINRLEGRSNNDFHKFYDELAGLSFYREQHFGEMLDNVLQIDSDTCHIIIMTQQLTMQLVEKLVRLKYSNYEISVVVCDVRMMDVDAVKGFGDSKVQFMLTTSRIPIYHVRHDEDATILGVP